ncbi:subtilase-type protease inhibitor [Streptomyces sp. GMY02]|uniref:SSI family serine proteinase inhibitor n=1 Tax=Streptomyces sp. GMY02 TaxID=1333528 RepID=UPI001C2C065A|nr:SSI family serine proteinase inhibitor [Streptomyces sp. GMY02]QXE35958.1 subtilase-type protease inhibitor [Streptomyces sp. GMY02]
MSRRPVLTAAVSLAAAAAMLGALAPAALAGPSSAPARALPTNASAPASALSANVSIPARALSANAPVPASVPSTDAPVPLPPLEAATDVAATDGPAKLDGPAELTVGVAHTGVAGEDGTYKLTCGPAGGTHPRARAACDRLAELAGAGQDPFAPVAAGAMCTMQHGGDATARITGTWRGHRVDAAFSRKNGCEIARWRTLEPVLPKAGL